MQNYENFLFFLCDAAILVGFNKNRYNFTEGTTGTLVVQKSGSFVSEITFRVVIPGLVNQTQTFAAGTGTPSEIDILFLIPDNDVALESDRVLSAQVEIISPMSQVALDNSRAAVIIHDDDGMLSDTLSHTLHSQTLIFSPPLCILLSQWKYTKFKFWQ